ncbi:hypothetical protein JCM21531_2585 [Acetivibrio straminisolvens JCM 21531]|uniref:Uncharacterized protein n=1 Tax=Acetivibrio straminisolvens JCM 21531 TaxID=1294263 RepID=W4V7D1_9FIRM|nr:hypothetical protein JCM21531_2585 [Acetivibrio straminisolvens JCM 21531]
MPKGRTRGKSGLHRAGCRVTPGEGDFKESATEIYRLLEIEAICFGFQYGKGGKVR